MKNKFETIGDLTIIYAGKGNAKVLIDTEDLTKINDYDSVSLTRGYAQLNKYQGKTVLMHRIIMNTPNDLVVDHINHNVLDNRKSNLRNVTIAQNNQNRKGCQKNNKTSGIRGVSYSNAKKKWVASISLNGKFKHLGLFDDMDVAVRTVQMYRELHMPYSKEGMEFAKQSDGKISNEELIRKAKNGDKDAEKLLFNVNERFCHHIAHKFKKSVLEHDDLFCIARLGMLKAYQKFDPDKGYAFITFASRCMENEIKMVMRKSQHKVKTISYTHASFEDKDGNLADIEDFLFGEDDVNIKRMIERQFLQEILREYDKKIKSKEKEVLYHRYISGDDQKEISKKMGLSQSYVSRLEKQAIKNLRKIAKKYGDVV